MSLTRLLCHLQGVAHGKKKAGSGNGPAAASSAVDDADRAMEALLLVSDLGADAYPYSEHGQVIQKGTKLSHLLWSGIGRILDLCSGLQQSF